MSRTCDRAEVLAGAIALGEATDDERNEYRAHLSACERCLSSLSGEREIERTAAVVIAARDSETWEPVLSPPWVAQQRRRNRLVRYAFSIGVIATGIALLLHFSLAASMHHINATPANPISLKYDGTRLTVERHAPQTVAAANLGARQLRQVGAAGAAAQSTPAPARIVVQHNVVTLKAMPQPASAKASTYAPPVNVERTDTQTVSVVATVHRRHRAADDDIPHTSLQTPQAQVAVAQTPQPMENHAESIAVMQPVSIRNAAPLGGDSAINPQPPMIAYAQGAEGTTAFEVQIDDKGNAVKCTITKSSGYLALDDTVCKAAMRAKYSPKIVNGRAVPGVYHDAFTFHTDQQ